MSGAHPRGPAAPSDWVVRWAHLIPANGRVLDLACGQGRHARYLAGRGHEVTACDRDPTALQDLAGIKGLTAICLDLEDGSPWPFAEGSFAGVVVTNYLHRPLFRAIPGLLAPRGVLVYETFVCGNERYGKPSNPRFLLKRDELLETFGRSLTIVGYEQGRIDRGKPALVQRLCAVLAEGLENDLEPPE
jgi:SAM-dependent methyltransferase